MNLAYALDGLEPFRSLSNGARRLLQGRVTTKKTKRSEAILQMGQRVSGAYVVLAGRLRVFTQTSNGTEATLYFLDPGDACVLALNCLFNDLLYPAWVHAETSAEIAVIPGPVYRTLFDSEPGIRDLTIKALSGLVYRLMEELEQVHATTHRERLARFIVTQASGGSVLRMTQQQIAGHLGTTREVIARLMQEFVANGLVRSRRGLVAIQDVTAMRRMITSAGLR
jgi:CRP/FNR family transcriptional regulator, anaerobic regulatory protein